MAPEARPITYLGPPPAASAALGVLSSGMRTWFQERFGEPTPAQCLAWPAVAAGQHLLLTAPTGTGKTLAAFVPVLDRLCAEPAAAPLRCLYVAPLRALTNDTRKTLRRCLRELRRHLPADTPPVRVAGRTGDTPARLRKRLLIEPPSLLLTTPESLAVLLAQPRTAALLAGVRWLVVDEVHALASQKRGADLALSLERLTELTGEGLQRIGLSATCAPLAEAARFLVGAERPCAVAQVIDDTPLHVEVEPLDERLPFLERLVERLGPELEANRSTIIFTNTRSLTERLAWALRKRYPAWDELIGVHHSALAAVRRRRVERRLKQGAYRAVVSSTSLELGIDVGTVDGVVLIHPPGGVVRLLQRLGRSGHGPGRPRRGLVLAAGAAELLEATVTLAAGRTTQYETVRVAAQPLDVLCQHLLGMAAERAWHPDAAFALVGRSSPFQSLKRADFDACLDYLSGRRGEEAEWLPPRLRWEGEHFKVKDRRTVRILLRNLGTILAEEPRTVRFAEGEPGPIVGQIDQLFAERLQPGDRFLLDGRCLECRRTEGVDLEVSEVVGRPAVPRWGGEGWPIAPELARRLYLMRLRAAEALRDGPASLEGLLREEYGLRGQAVSELVSHFQHQESISEIPGVATCLIESVPAGGVTAYYVHTPLNRAANDALARVAAWRLARRRGRVVTSLVADLGFALFWPGTLLLQAEDWRGLLSAEAFEPDLRAAVASSDTLRDRFRRVALTGLMLLRNPLGMRRRVGGVDWAERRLFERVRESLPDFVLLRQAEHEMFEDLGVAEALRFASDLDRMTVRCRVLVEVSAFAASWTQSAAGPVVGVEDPAEALRRLQAVLLGDVPPEGNPWA